MHSEEEIAGSYNWDYLLDWGPQYQPLAHVFHEISALKDEGGAGPQEPARVPPIITCRPPRHVHAPGSGLVPHHLLGHGAGAGAGAGARSPISHELGSPASAAAMSPSFSPALSPLATRSPSISPLGVAGAGPRSTVTRGLTLQSHYSPDYSDLATTEPELRI